MNLSVTASGLGLAALAAWLLAGALAAGDAGQSLDAGNAPPADARAAFARPEGLPAGAAPLSPAVVDLGRLLFNDTRLSGDGTLACASCHQAQLAFTDGQALHAGRNGKPLARHTPHLWNLAWSETLFWDGRAKSLEAQARGPVENPQEMAGSMATAVLRLKADPAMVASFARAFPGRTAVDEISVTEAIGAFERGLVSPITRFDRWVTGDETALDRDEKAGFALFTGKAQCTACHSSWRFTDEAFHDIGLPDTGDLGRGAQLQLPAANHGFKTPSLRELAWTAPYMHDGSLPTLEAVIEHYAGGVARRPTLSKDMPPVLALTAEERQQLVAFLGALSSEEPPRPPQTLPKVELSSPDAQTAPVAATTISQKDKRFTPGRVKIAAGQSLTIVNDDKRTHNVRIDDPRLTFTSNAQEAGDSVVIAFPEPGRFGIICSIHPAMKLDVTVERQQSLLQHGPKP